MNEEDEEEMRVLRQNSRYKAFEAKHKRNKESIPKIITPNAIIENNKTEDSNIDRNSFPTEFGLNSKIKSNQTSIKLHDTLKNIIKETENIPTMNKKETKNNNSQKEEEHKEDIDIHPTNNPSSTKKKSKEKNLTKECLEHVLKSYNLPLKYEAKLKGHSRLISTLTLDKKGTRLLTGSYDYSIRMWDFNSMKNDLQSFRNFIPQEGHPIIALDYNPTASHFLCVTGSAQPMIYNRDGHQILQFKKGDMYIKDMLHTSGHVMNCSGGKWYPKDHNFVLTWSQDSTLRKWDLTVTNGKCSEIIKCKSKYGKRLHITSADLCTKSVVCACNDGSLHLYDMRNPRRPKCIVYNAHVNGTLTSSCRYLPTNPYVFVSRGGTNDNTMKIWDVRKLKRVSVMANGGTNVGQQPVHVFNNLWNISNLSNVEFSPDNRLLLTSTSMAADIKQGKSSLVLIDYKYKNEILRIPISNQALGKIMYHSNLKQIFIADEKVCHVFYDEHISKNGALLCAKRKKKKRHLDEQMKYFHIINPNALRVYKRWNVRVAENRKRQMLKHKPLMPHYGIGVQGRINTENFSAFTMKSREKNVMSQVDPRDRLLMFDDKARQNMEYTAVYNVNQPKAVFAKVSEFDAQMQTSVAEIYNAMPGDGKYQHVKKYGDIEQIQENMNENEFNSNLPPKKKQKLL